MTDERPSARTRCCKPFRNKGFISDCYRRSRNCQRGGQFPRGGQPLSRSKAPVQNGLPDLAIYLAAKVISTNKTDMKSHSPGTRFCFGLDWQPCSKADVPSCRLASFVNRTAGRRKRSDGGSTGPTGDPPPSDARRDIVLSSCVDIQRYLTDVYQPRRRQFARDLITANVSAESNGAISKPGRQKSTLAGLRRAYGLDAARNYAARKGISTASV